MRYNGQRFDSERESTSQKTGGEKGKEQTKNEGLT